MGNVKNLTKANGGKGKRGVPKPFTTSNIKYIFLSLVMYGLFLFFSSDLISWIGSATGVSNGGLLLVLAGLMLFLTDSVMGFVAGIRDRYGRSSCFIGVSFAWFVDVLFIAFADGIKNTILNIAGMGEETLFSLVLYGVGGYIAHIVIMITLCVVAFIFLGVGEWILKRS